METTEGFTGLDCLSCGTTADATGGRCPECGGVLDPTYDDEVLARAHESFDDSPAGDRSALDGVLPFAGDSRVTLGEGGAALVACPTLAEELGVDRVLVADEGRNPTGGLVDRELALAVTAARESGAEEVALPTTGNGGQAAAAYAARAGLNAECFVPSRCVFANKAMINVHGGEMSVVGGRYPDAVEAFESASAEESWHSLAPFQTPYRHEGAKTLAYDLHAALDVTPDAIVHPTGHGTGLVGLAKGFGELADTGTVEGRPRLYAAQAAGCAPLVEAFEEGADEPAPVEHPDTICGALEVPDPAGGHLVLDALDDTDGGAVTSADDAILEGAASLAAAGVPMSATGGTAAAGARDLAESGVFEGDEVVVLVNPATANREADILRSHLMKQGI
jgi:threonine synthase